MCLATIDLTGLLKNKHKKQQLTGQIVAVTATKATVRERNSLSYQIRIDE